MSTEKDEIPEEKKMKMRLAIEEATKFRNELAKKIGITHPSTAEIIREDRDYGH